MKRFFAVVFLVLTVLAFLAVLAWCGYCVYDFQQMRHTAGVSGIDFLMTGTTYGFGLALICIVGAVSALAQSRLTNSKKTQGFGHIAVFAFLLGMIVAAILLFI